MKKILFDLISTLDYPIYQQGSFTDTDTYPDAFFTYWNFNTVVDKHYDNKEFKCVWSFWLNFYATDPELVDSMLIKARDLLKDKGWLVPGKGQDINSGHPDYSGRSLEIYFIEY